MRFHLFTAHELGDLFRPQFAIEDLRGLDIFHNRFVPDDRWNPAPVGPDKTLLQHLTQLEEAYATDPGFMERASHLLLVGRRSPTQKINAVCASGRGVMDAAVHCHLLRYGTEREGREVGKAAHDQHHAQQ